MIKTLNLYRCNAEPPKISGDDIHFVMTDYFDGVRVDDLSETNDTFADAMGIRRQSNSRKKGITNQRYCMFTEKEASDNIFQISEEFPLLTVIQVFLNPDIFQAGTFKDGKEISCVECIKRTEKCIRKRFRNNKNLKWQIFQLVTDGDFAIIVRSKKIHTAYHISSLIRSICVSVGEDVKANAFYSYTITGVVDSPCPEDEILTDKTKINWKRYLKKEDQVILRMIFSSELRVFSKQSDTAAKVEEFLQMGHRLFGRYDFQITLTPEEFGRIYPHLRDFKFASEKKAALKLNDKEIAGMGKKLQLLIFMIQNGYVDYFNERILLKYNDTEISGTQGSKAFTVWEVAAKSEWITLYEKNRNQIETLRDDANATEKKLEIYFQSARNLKEYTRLMGRIYRVLYEMNYRQELRISVANVLRQLAVMQASMVRWLDQAERYNWSPKEIASLAEGYLRMGMSAMEIFTRYVRNVNLHSFQTPNYDLQTNECIEKVLLAYSQFLLPFMTEDMADYDRV